jgi:phage baseplate assembly protein V
MWNDIDKRINRMLGRIRQAYRGRGTSINTSPKVMLMQGEALAGESIQAAEYIQHFGFTSSPPPGFVFIAVPVGGETSHSICVGTEHPAHRLLNLKSGESALYDAFGHKVYLTKDGIVVDGAGQDVQFVNAPNVLMDGNLKVAGDVQAAGDVFDHLDKSMAGMRTVFNGHHHNETGTITSIPMVGM